MDSYLDSINKSYRQHQLGRRDHLKARNEDFGGGLGEVLGSAKRPAATGKSRYGGGGDDGENDNTYRYTGNTGGARDRSAS